LYIQQEKVADDFFASTFTGTPDSKKEKMMGSYRLLIGWDFPLSWYTQELTLFVTVRFVKNDVQETFFYPIKQKRGDMAYTFPKDKSILTYRVQVLTKSGQIIETWKHQLWTELISIPKK